MTLRGKLVFIFSLISILFLTNKDSVYCMQQTVDIDKLKKIEPLMEKQILKLKLALYTMLFSIYKLNFQEDKCKEVFGSLTNKEGACLKSYKFALKQVSAFNGFEIDGETIELSHDDIKYFLFSLYTPTLLALYKKAFGRTYNVMYSVKHPVINGLDPISIFLTEMKKLYPVLTDLINKLIEDFKNAFVKPVHIEEKTKKEFVFPKKIERKSRLNRARIYALSYFVAVAAFEVLCVVGETLDNTGHSLTEWKAQKNILVLSLPFVPAVKFGLSTVYGCGKWVIGRLFKGKSNSKNNSVV